MVPPDSGRISRVPPYSRSVPTKPRACQVRDFHPLRSPFPGRSPIRMVFDSARAHVRPPAQPYNPRIPTVHAYHGIRVWALPPSLAATKGISSRFLLLQVLRWFSSLGLASVAYVFNYGCAGFYPHGLPHSVIPGSQDVCSSPGLFAAYYDLLRQTAP